jgi:hypothetical protein
LNEQLKNVSLFGLAPRGVCPATLVTKRAGKLLPHRFTHHLAAGLFSVALVVNQFSLFARTLSGSLLCGVRTFLSRNLFDSDYPIYSTCKAL